MDMYDEISEIKAMIEQADENRRSDSQFHVAFICAWVVVMDVVFDLEAVKAFFV